MWRKRIRCAGSTPSALALILGALAGGCASPWLEHETDHVVVHYKEGSHAQRNIEDTGAKLEASYLWMMEKIPVADRSRRYDVYLHENYKRAGTANKFTGNVAAAGVAYLIECLGEDGFWELYREVTRLNYQRKLEARRGMPVAEIDRAFDAFVSAYDPPPDVFR